MAVRRTNRCGTNSRAVLVVRCEIRLALPSDRIAATTAAVGRHLRAPGIALSAFTIFFFGFPFSGATSAPELLPQPWGHLGQLLPAGAASTALRSVALFDGAGAAHPLLTLTLWAVAALTLLVLRLADRASAPPVNLR